MREKIVLINYLICGVKLKKHVDSESHKIAQNILEEGQKKRLEECFNTVLIAEEEPTSKIFRTAYYLAKNNRPFTDHEDLVRLQQINGIDLGSILHSRFTAKNIINHIANEMRKQLISRIVNLQSKLSVLIDESTSLSNKTTLIIYLKTSLGGENPECIFLDLCELDSQDAEHIEMKLLETLKIHGFNEEYLKTNWIAIATDGASVMVGKYSGVVTRLRQRYPKLFTWHCLNHRLELSVSDVIKDVRGINHFKSFLDKLYTIYSQSPKNSRALECVCHELGLKFKKVGRVLGMRWVASSFNTVRAYRLWDSYEALYRHFKTSCEDPNLTATFLGLKRKLESPEFLLDLGLMYDILQELSVLSTELQSRITTLPRAEHLIKRTLRIIESFKENPGEKTQIALIANEDMIFKNIILVRNTKIMPINKDQFIQSMVDRMKSRLCSDSNNENIELLKDISALDPNNIKTDDIRYGEAEVRRICRRFNVDELEAIAGLRDFTENIKSVPEKLKPLLTAISSLPCSTAECERGFSLMNNIITDLRASLLISNVSNLMFINANGPPVEKFQPKKYVRSWLVNHRSAIDTQSRVCSSETADSSRQDLWDIFQEY